MLHTLRNGAGSLRRVRDDMDRWLQAALQGGWPLDVPGLQGYPPMNLWETDQALHVEMEVPGIAQSDLEIEVTGKDVTLRGRRKAPEVKEAVYHRRERQVGQFERSLQVPIDIDGEKVEARLVDGVLHVTLPKAAAAKPRKIAVRGA